MDSQTQIPEKDDQSNESFDIRRYAALLWHWAWVIILTALLAAGTAYFVSKLMKPVYQASTVVLVNEAPSDKALDTSTLQLSSELTQTYSQMMTKSTILDAVASRLGIVEIDPRNVTAEPVTNTQLITISVESTDPILAVSIANTLVAVFSDTIQSLQNDRFSTSEQSLQTQMADIEQQIQATNASLAQTTDPAEKDLLETSLTNYQQIYSSLLQSYEQVRLTAAQTISSIAQIEPAVLPKSAVSPRPMINSALAGIIGLLLSGGLIFGIDMLDDTFKSPKEITQKLGLPILSVITHIEKKEEWPITAEQPRSQVSETFRNLRTNIQFAGASIDQPMKVIIVTSSLPEEGKTTVIVNLGVVLAQSGLRVALVDGDLRRPAVHRFLQLDNRIGLSHFFVQAEPIFSNSLQESWIKNLSVLTSGKIPPNPSELLGSQKMGAILKQLRTDFDIVLIDTPPALAVTDAAALLPFVDGVLLVIKQGRSRITSSRVLVDQLRRMKANLLGVVVNDVNLRNSSYGYYYGNYHYANQKDISNGYERSKKEKAGVRSKLNDHSQT